MFGNTNNRKRNGYRPGNERDLGRESGKQQDDYEYDRYVYGDDEAW